MKRHETGTRGRARRLGLIATAGLAVTAGLVLAAGPLTSSTAAGARLALAARSAVNPSPGARVNPDPVNWPNTVTAPTNANPIAVNTMNWTGNAEYGSAAPGWSIDSFGIVHLQGAAKQISATGAGANTVGTLPPAARPTRTVYTIVHTFAGTYADLEIATTGQLYLINPLKPAVPNYAFVSLEGITYRPAGTVNALATFNGANWSGSAGYGASAPGWFTDGSGIVHLQGAVTQLNTFGTGPNLIGTVPATERPSRTVRFIVHTFNGTYSALAIDTSGNIYLINTELPAHEDFKFVSLEGVSYYPLSFVNSLAPPFPGLNTANWSGNAGYGSSEPGWIEDAAGVIHLEGAAMQINSSTGDPNLIATLPAVIRPTRTIYTIVPTEWGSYADLSIGTDGSIRVIYPALAFPPGVYVFVSLEGITYQP
jgi:hypothetical protein